MSTLAKTSIVGIVFFSCRRVDGFGRKISDFGSLGGKSEESEEIWEESQETEGKRGGTNGKGQREAVEEERAAGAEKIVF